MARMSSGFKATLLACAAWMALAACAAPAAAPTASNTSAAPSTAAGKGIQLKDGEKLTVGFIFVGTADDYGYNYAADQGRLALEKNLPYVKTLAAYSVPENAEAERVMEDMIRQGAKIIFPTSYGHLDPAMNVAKRHPEVTFLHQGGLKNTTNVGTYFGEIWQDVYAAGIVAGKESKTGKLGFVAAFPIPQVLLNINAFELGAKSVNPDVKTTVVFTADWCNPGKLTDAANTLMDGGADVLTAHEDCPAAVIQAAERRGMMSVGYHADGSPLAPKGWLTGARWTWDGLYTDLVKQVVAGTYVSQIYRAGVKDNVVGLSPFGAAVTPDVRTLATNAEKGIIDGSVFPFQGPVTDQSGKIRIEAGKRPNTTELESTDYLVDGVIGTIPS
jgi:basic membrane lipoprotein Med (substrate-binding protein (PBP1-ABC) superfamily)